MIPCDVCSCPTVPVGDTGTCYCPARTCDAIGYPNAVNAAPGMTWVSGFDTVDDYEEALFDITGLILARDEIRAQNPRKLTRRNVEWMGC